MDFIGIIYTWVCQKNGKGYVGLSRSSSIEKTRKRINTPDKLLYNRWKGHILQSNYNPKDCFHFAIRKYGHENFHGKIIKEFCAGSIEEIKKLVDEAEQYYIEENNTLVPNGYNLQKGGFSPLFHPDTCIKMQRKKQAFLNKEEGREWIQKCIERQLSHFQTKKGLEQAKKHSECIKEKYETNPDIKTNISNSLLQYFDTPEGKIQIEKQKKFMIEFYKTKDSEKMRNYLSECAKKRWENDEYRRNQIIKGKERFAGEEGVIRRENLKIKANKRMEDPEKRKLASEKTIAYFDKKGRVEYTCDICYKCTKEFRDKTGYDRHCKTKNHKLRLSKQEAKINILIEPNEKDITKDYTKMTVEELKQLCRDEKITGFSGKKKEELINMLSN